MYVEHKKLNSTKRPRSQSRRKREKKMKWKCKINGISSCCSSSPFHFSFLFSCLLSRTGPAPDGNQLIASANETERNGAMVLVRVRCKLATHSNVFMKKFNNGVEFFALLSISSLLPPPFVHCLTAFRMCAVQAAAGFFLHVSVSRFVSMCSEYFSLYETKTAMKTTFSRL